MNLFVEINIQILIYLHKLMVETYYRPKISTANILENIECSMTKIKNDTHNIKYKKSDTYSKRKTFVNNKNIVTLDKTNNFHEHKTNNFHEHKKHNVRHKSKNKVKHKKNHVNNKCILLKS